MIFTLPTGDSDVEEAAAVAAVGCVVVTGVKQVDRMLNDDGILSKFV